MRSTLVFLTLFLVACGPPPGGPQEAETAQVAAPISAPVTQQPLSAEQVRLERAIAGDLDPAGRRAAIDVYADEQGGRRELLRSLSTESDPVVRRWAALAMERRAAPEDGVALQQLALSEPDPVVKNILERAAARSAR